VPFIILPKTERECVIGLLNMSYHSMREGESHRTHRERLYEEGSLFYDYNNCSVDISKFGERYYIIKPCLIKRETKIDIQ